MHYLLLIFTIFWAQISSGTDALTTIGWIEPVKIYPEGIEMQAKIDTGADNSSLGVIDWHSYMIDDEEWIRFTTINNNNKQQVIERPLDRYARIKRKQENSLKRPVVKMWLCIGNKLSLTSVNLAKRNQFKFRMLIGRSLLKGNYLVNSATELSTFPQCTLPKNVEHNS